MGGRALTLLLQRQPVQYPLEAVEVEVGVGVVVEVEARAVN